MGSMSIDSDFEALLECFTARSVRFLVVGGYAVGCHGLARATKDLDVWVEPEAENAVRAWTALAEFGLPLGDIRPSDLATAGPWLQFGVAPKRIDILTRIEGVEFAVAWERRVPVKMGRVIAPVLSLDDLLCNKRKVGRPQDLADVARLVALDGTRAGASAPRRASSARKTKAGAPRRSGKRRGSGS